MSRADPSSLLDPFCRALLGLQASRAGLDPALDLSVDDWMQAFKALPKFRPLIEAFSTMANRHGASAAPPGSQAPAWEPDACARRFPHPDPLPEGEGDSECSLRDFHGNADELRTLILQKEPDLKHHVALAEVCAEALPDVLAGRVLSTDVLFPKGSMQQVEPIYKNNPWADYFNRLTGEACFKGVEAWRKRLSGGRVRILEIGAGTGGTTRSVLDRLSGCSQHFDYCYTDISQGFLQHGLKSFGSEGFHLEFKRLDIEQDAEISGLALESFHIVIATNVLHATRRIDTTLRQVRRFLVQDGLLLLNELTQADAFAALTFGLLDGWWRFEDGERRIPYAPVLSADGWREALVEGGFRSPVVYGWKGSEQGFQCLFVTTASAAVLPKPAIQKEVGIEASIRMLLAERLGFSEHEIDPDRPFAELGVDSIVAPQFAADLTQSLNIEVDAIDIFNHGSLSMLADALARRAPEKTAEPIQNDEEDHAIAVIGLACRFAGAIDAEAFWDLLEKGVDATERVSIERWKDSSLSMTAGLLPEADCFDPDFFRLSHAEASVMDPQQRVFLEECWHALEDAGLNPKALDGKACGVFVGVAAQNHPENQGDARAALGNSNAILAARIAYHLNLKGPALPVDTACSSSLAAIHLACQAIRQGDCDIALAGGVSVLLCTEALPRFLQDAGMVSKQGQCRAFDASADGFVPGEGVGVLVLKRLDRALQDRDRILGVIPASGINQDGRTSGITAPSGPAQTALLKQVWQRAHINPARFSLIEAHGTGTPLGDPIEVQSLIQAIDGKSKNTCALGSVKPNIGHTLTAAGVASVIKVLLALKHQTIPASIHFQKPNPRLNLEASHLYVPVTSKPWEAASPRLAAVSSFGFSGTNAHIVIEEAPSDRTDAFESRPCLILLSAHNKPVLQSLSKSLADWLEIHPDAHLSDLARTLNAGRAYLPERAAFRVSDVQGFKEALRALSHDRDHAGLYRNASNSSLDEIWSIGAQPDLEKLALHFVGGGRADWEKLGLEGRVVSLPGYPFMRDRFPLPATPESDVLKPLAALIPHDDPSFKDHVWDGKPLLPAAALLVLAARLKGSCAIEAVRWHKPLFSDVSTASLRIKPSGHVSLESDEGLHAEAFIKASSERPDDPRPAAQLPLLFDHEQAYARFRQMGFGYGPSFRLIQSIRADSHRAIAMLEGKQGPISQIAWVDAAIQSGLGLVGQGAQPVTVLPIGLKKAWIDLDSLIPPMCVEVSEAKDEPGGLNLTVWNASNRVALKLEGLSIRIKQASDESLIYRPVWQKALALKPYRCLDGKTVLLFDCGLERRAGLNAILIEPGIRFRRIDSRHYELPPGDEPSLKALIDDLTEQGVQADLWLDCWPLAGLDPFDSGCLTLMHGLMHGLSHQKKPLRIVQVGLAQEGAIDSDPTVALLRSLSQEHAYLSGKVLGLADAGLDWMAEIWSEDADEVYIDSSGQRHIRRYKRVSLPLLAPKLQLGRQESLGNQQALGNQLPQGAVCLITGGMGGLGLMLARHLSKTCRLVLIGRNHSAEVDKLIAEGLDVLEILADVCDWGALNQAIDSVYECWGGVHAVFHLAGVQSDGFLRNQRPDDLASVLNPKILGVRNLLSAFSNRDLPLFVAFGSIAGSLGAPGQAAYATANRAMASLLDRQAFLKPERRFVCMDWGYWNAGMQTQHRDAESVFAATGLKPFSPGQGFDLMDKVLASGLSGRLLLVQGDAHVFESFMEESPSPKMGGGATPSAVSGEGFLDYVKRIVSEVIKTPVERLHADRPLDELGIDSIMITRLNARLERDLGRISKTLFFEHPNLRSLADFLAQKTGSQATFSSQAGAWELESLRDLHDIAIIGMAGRFPDARDVTQFWRNLLAGLVSIKEIPNERWPLHGFYDPDPESPGASYSKWGGFIDDVDRFDPLFFNISPDEAARMDPQERLFLEVAWQCLEDAGLTRADLGKTGERDIGVYLGVMYGDYQLLANEAAGPGKPIGGAAPYWSIANRVSYCLGLEGPSFALDSACSSSLSALHLACQAIKSGDCSQALVGGVNLSLHPAKYIGLSQGRFASTDGLCHSFGAEGDGYVPGEGVAAILIKPLSKALADGDAIQGVICASAVNHGGRTNGYTVPNPSAQASVIRRALRQSGIQAADLGYIEAHGTGTRLGDPIEIEGLVQGLQLRERGLIPLGSAKASIGHLEAAAGLAGLIKVLLQMRHETYAPMPLSGSVNPNIDFNATPLRLQLQASPWPRQSGKPRFAGVSSFGAGGANAHVIVREAPESSRSPDDFEPKVIALSARTQEQVRALAGLLADYLSDAESNVSLADLCHTLTLGREHLRMRCAFIAQDLDHAKAVLKRIESRQEGLEVIFKEAPDKGPASSAPMDLKASIAHWCQGGEALWPCSGKRKSLVARPFLGARHWLGAKKQASDWRRRPRALNPGESQAWIFSIDADSTLFSQHIVGGQRLLPGAAIVAMALELGYESLHDLTWVQPIQADSETLELDFALSSADKGETLSVRLVNDSQLLASCTLSHRRLESQSLAPESSYRSIESDAFYALLQNLGIAYGPRFKRIARLWQGDFFAKAELIERETLSFDASLIDVSFQSLAGLMGDLNAFSSDQGIPVPHTLGAVYVSGDLRLATQVFAQRLSSPDDPLQRFQLSLADAQGRVLLQLNDLTARHRSIQTDEPIRLLHPVWRAKPLNPKKTLSALIAAAPGSESLAEAFAQRFVAAKLLTDAADFDAYKTFYYLDLAQNIEPPPLGDPQAWSQSAAERCLNLLSVLKKLKGSKIQNCLIVTRGAFSLHPGDESLAQSDAAGLHGLAKVAQREMPGIRFSSVDLAYDPVSFDLLAGESGDEAGSEILYRHGRRLVRRLQPVEASSGFNALLETGDVCLIVGGAGGVGRTLAEHWAKEASARIVLLGRRPIDSDIQALLGRLKSLGGEGLYIQADACDKAALNSAILQAKSHFGPIRLAVQSALALKDLALQSMSRDDFLSAFEPRARVGAALIDALKDEPLKALLLFSSANVFLGQPGQGNYVAGNAALAALGQAASASGMPVQSVHWGLWGEVGAVADAETQARFLAEGVLPISPQMGVKMLSHALALGCSELAAIRVKQARLESTGLVLNESLQKIDSIDLNSDILDRLQSFQADEALDESLDAFKALETYGLVRAAIQLNSMLGAGIDRRMTLAGLEKCLGLIPIYRPFLKALLHRLALQGFVEARDGLWRLGLDLDLDASVYLDALKPWALRYDWFAANLALLETCLDAYPEVLQGRLDAASVLFADGKGDKLAVAYRGNPVSDYFNAMLASVVASDVKARLSAGQTARILEVGAGTGGGTLPLLDALKPWRDSIRYKATDLSAYLAKNLQDSLKDRGWMIESSGLDIAQAPNDSDKGAYDVIVAVNVVHATADVGRTLSHLRAMLAPGGRLVMNELTAYQDMGTLIFGLTPQWWSAIDLDSRIKHCPAILPEVWFDLLAENGFIKPVLSGLEGLSQSIISAVADRWFVLSGHSKPVEIQSVQEKPGNDAIVDYLKGIFSDVLGVDPADMRLGDTFDRYGVESLSALEISKRIAVLYPEVGSTLLFEHNTLSKLSAHLSNRQRISSPLHQPDLPSRSGEFIQPDEAPIQHDASRRGEFIRPTNAQEPIAIIGFSGRFPGGETQDSFWSLLKEGRNAFKPIPNERWNHALFLDQKAQGLPEPGKCRTRLAGLLDDIAGFDALFFGIPPLEALNMDPQERLFLEACWNAMEDAGTTPERLVSQARQSGAAASVGVFCGVMNTGYQWLAAEAWQMGDDQAASTHFWSIPNRVSYCFDFDGPSIALDTACSSSLTALHLACDALRLGSCGAALAGGVNLISHPRQLVNLAQAGMTTEGSECLAFGEGAKGFVDGEGVGVVLLKTLSQAQADGDRIDGLILGSAINAGGKTSGFTVPNPNAQAAAIQTALSRSNLKADGLCMIETHGTGTHLGDPIEMAGLLAGFEGLKPAKPWVLGTLKANIGHLEAAAGIASLIKVLLQFRHEAFVPARHASKPNPLIRWDEMPFRLPVELEPWPKPEDRPRRAAISGFGAGGSNAHLIVEQAPESLRTLKSEKPVDIRLSAKSPEQLAILAERMIQAIERLDASDPDALLADIARTLRLGRVQHESVAHIQAHDLKGLIDSLHRLVKGDFPTPSPFLGEGRGEGPGPIDPDARPISLPTYPFAKQSYWLDRHDASAGRFPHPLPLPEGEGGFHGEASLECNRIVTRLYTRRWQKQAIQALDGIQDELFLIGGDSNLVGALSGLGFEIKRLFDLHAARTKAVCMLMVDDRQGAQQADSILKVALDVACHAAKLQAPVRLLHVSLLDSNGRHQAVARSIHALLASLTIEKKDCIAGAIGLDRLDASAMVEELRLLKPQGRLIKRSHGSRWHSDIAKLPDERGLPDSFRMGGLYVWVGGLGEVGRSLAKAMVNRYGARIVILGRSKFNASLEARLEAIGGEVSYRSCDINDSNALEQSLASIAAQGRIDGVMHLGRSVHPSALQTMKPENAQKTFDVKIQGSLNLIQALKPHKPDWLIFFSSLAAWAGQAGGADYAAACAFQDGLAECEADLKLISIAWPQWQYDTFLNDEKRSFWSEKSLQTLDAECGLEALNRILPKGPGAYALMRGDEAAMDKLMFDAPILESNNAWQDQLEGLDAQTLNAYKLYLQGLYKPIKPEPALFTESVLAICSDYLKISPEKLMQTTFPALGLDSIRALHLAERLQRQLKRPVEPVMLFENPNIGALARALSDTDETS